VKKAKLFGITWFIKRISCALLWNFEIFPLYSVLKRPTLLIISPIRRRNKYQKASSGAFMWNVAELWKKLKSGKIKNRVFRKSSVSCSHKEISPNELIQNAWKRGWMEPSLKGLMTLDDAERWCCHIHIYEERSKLDIFLSTSHAYGFPLMCLNFYYPSCRKDSLLLPNETKRKYFS
jgi:hypothetical protein